MHSGAESCGMTPLKIDYYFLNTSYLQISADELSKYIILRIC